MARPRIIMAGLGLMATSIIAGVAPTIIGMVSAFNDAASEGSVDASKLSDDVGNAMIWTAILMPVAFAGLCLLIAGLIMAPKHTRRAEQGGEPDAASRRQLP